VTDGNLLRAQTSAASAALNAQLGADETKMKQVQRGDVLERLLKAIADAKAARGPVRELPQLDVLPEEDTDGEAAD